MRLVRARLVNAGPLGDLLFRFASDDDRVRSVTCVLGGGGTGKTSLLAALAATRPGHAVVQPRAGRSSEPGWAVVDWLAGDDDLARPHPLRVATPNAPLDEDDAAATHRRREQAAYDRRAGDGGFVFVALPACRWFARSPVVLGAPDRTLGRWDVRAPASFDDPSRAELAREIKQTLSYVAIATALRGHTNDDDRGAAERRVSRLDDALRASVGRLVDLAGFAYEGADPDTLEPVFRTSDGRRVPFDDLPTGVRNLVAFAVLPVRALHAAYPDRDPRDAEAVVAIDDVELHQDAAVTRHLAAALRDALPRVQWILTSSSSAVALGCEPREVLALRRMEGDRVELHEGELAVVH